MARDIDYSNLGWVRSEIDVILKQASDALEAYAADGSDAHQLQFCVTHVHQVRSILQMLELFGAAMLAEEIEGLGIALVKKKVGDERNAVELLMRSILQLSDYLEALQHGHSDLPILLLPQLNDLRATYGKSLLSELAFFAPDLSKVVVKAKIPYSVEKDANIRAATKKLRPVFQLAMLGWFRDHNVDNIRRLLEVLRRMQFMSMHDRSATFWFVCSALIEGVALQSIRSSAAVNLLLGHVDRQLKMVSDLGEKAFLEQMPEKLYRNILYYVAYAKPRGKRVMAVQQAFNLKAILPNREEIEKARENLRGPAAAVLETVSQALKDDLNKIKDSVDLLARKAAESDELKEVISSLGRVGDTMGMLGFGSQRNAVKHQIEHLQPAADNNADVPEADLMELASLLLELESQIDDVVRSGNRSSDEGDSGNALFKAEFRRVEQIVVHECLDEIGKAKEALIDYSVSPNDFDRVGDVPATLDKVRGALAVLEMSEAQEILTGCGEFIQTKILDTKVAPSYFYLEAIAEALSALEYQMECIQERRSIPVSAVQNAKSALESLHGEPPAGYQMPVKKEAQFETELDDGGDSSLETIGSESSLETIDSGSSFETIETSGTSDSQFDVIDVSDIVTEKPAAPAPQPAAEAYPDGYENAEFGWLNDDADEEIVEVFAEEAEEILENIAADFDALSTDIKNNDAITNLRRSFHTLKGSGRLAGSPLIGEIYWAMESLFNDVLEAKIEINPSVVSLARESYDVLPAFVARIKDNEPVKFDPTTIITRAEALRSGKEISAPASSTVDDSSESEDPEPAESFSFDSMPEVEAGFDEISPEDLEIDLDFGDVEIEGLDLDFEGLSEAEEQNAPSLDLSEFQTDDIDEQSVAEPTPVAPEPEEPEDEVDTLYQVFTEEARDHLASLNRYLESVSHEDAPHELDSSLQIATHTLAGCAQTAKVSSVARVSRSLDQLIQLHIELKEPLDNRDISLIADSVVLVSALIDDPNADDRTSSIDGLCVKLEKRFLDIDRRHREKLAAQAADDAIAEQEDLSEADSDLMNLFFAEAEDTLQFLNESLVKWKNDLSDKDTVASLQRALHTLKGGARMTGYNAIADLSGLLEQVAANLLAGKLTVTESIVEELQSGLDHLAELFEFATRREAPQLSEQLMERFQKLIDASEAERTESKPSQNQDSAPQEETAVIEDVDQELVEVFMEEAVEVLDSAETELQKWKATPAERAPVEALQRLLHTLKGGARMAGFVPIGNLSHQMESAIIGVVDGNVTASDNLFATLEVCYDRLHTMVELAQSGRPLGSVGDLVEKLTLIMQGKATDVAPESGSNEAEVDDTVNADEAAQQSRTVPVLQQDSVKISAQMIDRLVNYAGEISIYRSRFEQQLGAIGFNLVELEQTVFRLREQLRRLEIEAEAQILYRYEEAGAIDEEFDPLEFDRFSQVQQLSRSLAESVSDLSNIQGTLMGLSRESEVLLVQQARLNTDLQEGLMRTRMVPFSTLVPRLRRIVRQTAHELGKKAELKIGGTQGEMDRTVLERVTAPLEHMLRNALAHGIESEKQRKKSKKPETGSISVRMYREGSEVVLRVDDDGAGMKIDAIRKKAQERGLLDKNAKLSDKEVMQFVLQSGFSTADNVSQIAGRGVGMDVVNNEIKQMGGSLEIDSVQGKGTTFTARLPFTLAVNQALLVQAGNESYAIPLASIEGVMRLSREELRKSEASGSGYLYAGYRYQIMNLDNLLGLPKETDHMLSSKHVALLLIQAGEHRVALEIDGLMGSREIVVKSVGPQLSSIQGIMGATILGDGKVVLILDVVALTRAGLSGVYNDADEENIERVDASRLTAMVVDDSITMRKATKRLLERNNMKVVLAKDGVDAIAKLNEVIPDVMLLDVEMPRMDGFELAMHVRRDAKLKHIPIIMITSRSGEKHRRRAFDIGVNRYLGKPYQEAELMENIVSVMGGSD